MDINKISNEIATLKRAVKTAATASLKDKLKKKIVSLNEVLKDANIPAKRLAMILLGAKRKVFSYTTAEFNAVIKRLSYKAEYSFLKGLTKPEIKDDLERYAKNPGWRFKGRGNYKTPTKKDLAADAGLPYGKRRTYYEKRSNRSDVTNPAKLKDGGVSRYEPFWNDLKVIDKRTGAIWNEKYKNEGDADSFQHYWNLAKEQAIKELKKEDKLFNKMETGGGVENENKEMVLNNAQQIEHHAEELENAAKNSKHVPAWVVAKIYNASSNISDATHYLEGVNTMPKEQFERIHEEVENHKMETGGGLNSFLGKQMHVSKVCKTHGCTTKDYLHAKKKYKTGGIPRRDISHIVLKNGEELSSSEIADGVYKINSKKYATGGSTMDYKNEPHRTETN